MSPIFERLDSKINELIAFLFLQCMQQMWGESVQLDQKNTERPAAATMAVAGQDAQTSPSLSCSPALKTYHFQWSGFGMLQKGEIGCTGRVSPLYRVSTGPT